MANANMHSLSHSTWPAHYLMSNQRAIQTRDAPMTGVTTDPTSSRVPANRSLHSRRRSRRRCEVKRLDRPWCSHPVRNDEADELRREGIGAGEHHDDEKVPEVEICKIPFLLLVGAPRDAESRWFTARTEGGSGRVVDAVWVGAEEPLRVHRAGVATLGLCEVSGDYPRGPSPGAAGGSLSDRGPTNPVATFA